MNKYEFLEQLAGIIGNQNSEIAFSMRLNGAAWFSVRWQSRDGKNHAIRWSIRRAEIKNFRDVQIEESYFYDKALFEVKMHQEECPCGK